MVNKQVALAMVPKNKTTNPSSMLFDWANSLPRNEELIKTIKLEHNKIKQSTEGNIWFKNLM